MLYEISTGHDRQQFPELPTGITELPDRAALAEFNEVLLRACAPDVKAALRIRRRNARRPGAAAKRQVRGPDARGRAPAQVRRPGGRAGHRACRGRRRRRLALAGASRPRIVRQLAQEKETGAQSWREENLYFADIRVAYHDWESGQIAGMLDRLRRHIPQGSEPDLRGWEWYYLLSLCHRDERTLRGHTAGVRTVSCDPDGTALCFGK